jgi:hypothetical protein
MTTFSTIRKKKSLKCKIGEEGRQKTKKKKKKKKRRRYNFNWKIKSIYGQNMVG